MATVLIVDDSRLARMAVAKVVQALHPAWTCVEATSATDAVAVALTEKPDIALLDVNMPGLSGLVALAELRSLYPHMPIAMVSANDQREIVDQARGFGAVFLPKPLDQNALDGFLAALGGRDLAGLRISN